MANYWAIAIGINQYESFGPLNYAKADAEDFRDFLVQEAGLAPENCLLMTDDSPLLDGESTCPTQANVYKCLDKFLQQVQPEDQLWLFFSGYGVSHNGQDYLMPVEGHRDRIIETGIEMRSLLQRLHSVKARTVLVLLDMNRTQGDAVGQETIELAQELQLSTILSCRPEEVQSESLQLGNGLFTFALLEAWRAGFGSTLRELQTYLSDRLPELCHHNSCPIQSPVIIIEPPEITDEVILPHLRFSGWQNSSNMMYPQPLTAQPPVISNLATTTYSPHVDNRFIPTVPANYTRRSPGMGWLTKLLLWLGGGVLLVGLSMGVFLRNRNAFVGQQAIAPPERVPTVTNPPVVPAAPNTAPSPPIIKPPANTAARFQRENRALLNQAQTNVQQSQASEFSRAIQVAQQIQPGQPLYAEAQQNIDRWSRVILDVAKGRANKGEFTDAIAAARLITPDLPVHAQAQPLIQQWQASARQQVANKTLLDAAAALIIPGQASSYNRAIEVARRIPDNQPGSNQAEELINNWSGRILAIAYKRAGYGNINGAIETAALVPPGTAAYPQAQQALQKWKQNIKR